jgi:hypothetical protein
VDLENPKRSDLSSAVSDGKSSLPYAATAATLSYHYTSTEDHGVVLIITQEGRYEI